MRFLIILLLLTFSSCNGKDSSLSTGYITSVVRKIANAFEQDYVFPEIGKKVCDMLLRNVDIGRYSEFLDYNKLANQLQADIYDICRDKHLKITYLATTEEENYRQGTRGQEFMDSFDNFGFTKTEILEGNIGYMKLDIFYPVRADRKALQVATDQIQTMIQTKALIFDLRECRGGDPGMLSHLVSYLFPPDSIIHLNTFYYRPNNYTFDTFTTNNIKGERYLKPVYILTSDKTFSCAEEFTYDLKHLKRATIVGDTTGGGAHTVEPRKIDNNFEINLPTGRAINPVTGTNWEGTGVVPHRAVPAEKALNWVLESLNK